MSREPPLPTWVPVDILESVRPHVAALRTDLSSARDPIRNTASKLKSATCTTDFCTVFRVWFVDALHNLESATILLMTGRTSSAMNLLRVPLECCIVYEYAQIKPDYVDRIKVEVYGIPNKQSAKGLGIKNRTPTGQMLNCLLKENRVDGRSHHPRLKNMWEKLSDRSHPTLNKATELVSPNPGNVLYEIRHVHDILDKCISDMLENCRPPGCLWAMNNATQ